MPLKKLIYKAGLNREGTNYSNEGGFYDGDKIRFRSGLPEKIGGWIQVTATQFLGICMSLWTWLDLNSLTSFLGVGTTIKYYIYSGGSYFDITPIVQTDTLTNPFSTAFSTLNGAITSSSTSITLTSGTSFPASGLIQIDSEQIYYTTLTGNVLSGLTRGYNGTTAASHSNGANVGCATITVLDSSYNPSSGDYILMGGAYTVGGITVLGEYLVASNPTLTTYTFNASTFSTSATTGGGTVVIKYEYPSGTNSQVAGTGWGAGVYGGATALIPTSLTGPFATTNGSSTITVTQTGHGLTTGQWVNFSLVSSAVSGIPAIVLQQDYQVTVVNSNSYTISEIGRAHV